MKGKGCCYILNVVSSTRLWNTKLRQNLACTAQSIRIYIIDCFNLHFSGRFVAGIGTFDLLLPEQLVFFTKSAHWHWLRPCISHLWLPDVTKSSCPFPGCTLAVPACVALVLFRLHWWPLPWVNHVTHWQCGSWEKSNFEGAASCCHAVASGVQVRPAMPGCIESNCDECDII